MNYGTGDKDGRESPMKELTEEFLCDGKPHRIVYLTPGHAPSLITTLSPNGTVNVATFEQTMVCSNVPPVILVAISPKSDTLHNILERHEAVIGFVWPRYVQQLFDAGVRLPRGESELLLIPELTTSPSKTVAPPRVDQCWLSAETRLKWSQDTGDHWVLGMEVHHAALATELWSEDPVARRNGLPALYYTTDGHFFERGEEHVVTTSPRVREAGHAG
jgi:flavin reductase (DIM6/NTAB) family NADH-FMN oxidoreductase RutF